MPIESKPTADDSNNDQYFEAAAFDGAVNKYARCVDVINFLIMSPGIGDMPLDDIITLIRNLTPCKAYTAKHDDDEPEQYRRARDYNLNNAISNAIKTYINAGTINLHKG